ncbi:hypothetical protein ANO11243_018140 [Dothideomycetidae sp. 11243]|nr:hypothetical protein ANO11243_018140 [fungal sp. No.11243]
MHGVVRVTNASESTRSRPASTIAPRPAITGKVWRYALQPLLAIKLPGQTAVLGPLETGSELLLRSQWLDDPVRVNTLASEVCRVELADYIPFVTLDMRALQRA